MRAEMSFRADTKTLLDVVKWADERIAEREEWDKSAVDQEDSNEITREIELLNQLKKIIADHGFPEPKNWSVTTPKETE